MWELIQSLRNKSILKIKSQSNTSEGNFLCVSASVMYYLTAVPCLVQDLTHSNCKLARCNQACPYIRYIQGYNFVSLLWQQLVLDDEMGHTHENLWQRVCFCF